MPGDLDRETPIPLRRFQGTLLALDPAFVPGGYLTRSDNWVPHPALVLTKRGGLVPFRSLPVTGRVDPLAYATKSDGHRYLYALVTDTLYVSADDGPFVAVAGGAFTVPAERYGAAVFGDTLYVGSDLAPVKSIPLGGAATDLTPLAFIDDAGASATATDDAAANCLAGTYSYRWAVYNHATKQWTKIANVRTLTTGAAARQRLAFTAPTVTLGPDEKWHLFLAGVSQEIEGAHDQAPDGLAPAATFAVWDEPVVTTTVVPSPSSVVRYGSRLVAHRGRLWGAGGVGAARRRVWMTSILVPGLEQALYDQGLFFPAGGLTPDLGAPVSGLAVATLSTTNRSPTSPLGIMTDMGTWLFFGDPLDDPSAQLVQVSDEIGCVSDRTIAATPLGVLFLGKRSVYLLLPQQAEPKDVGWPIESAVRAQPNNLRDRAWGMYHRGFYKVVLVAPGGTEPTQQWWLDLRRGLGDPPSWWGPHSHPALTAGARASNHPDEDDRAWVAVAGTGELVRYDVLDVPTDTVAGATTPIVSRLATGWLDGGNPLQNKLAKRVRGVARVDGPSGLGITVIADDVDAASGAVSLPASVGGEWNVAEWNVDDWTVIGLRLFEFEAPVPEPRGRAFMVELTHSDPVVCQLRDVELRVQPSGRDAAGSY